jgi:predicted RNase H-like HicB family nuclease
MALFMQINVAKFVGVGYWAEVPAIPGCATEGDSWDELLSNLDEAILLWERLLLRQRLRQRQRRLFISRS